MTASNVYLNFDGNCREAMTFYTRVFNSECNFTPFSAGPPEVAEVAKTDPDRVLHAEMHAGPFVLMASDSMPGMPHIAGNNFSISLSCESREEMDRLFDTLAEGGKVTVAPEMAFWGGRFGMLIDRFGISWMLSFR